MDGACNLGIN
jgi:hypothetical protein